MKKILLLVLFALSSMNLVCEDIYSLLPRPKAAYEKYGQFGINPQTVIYIPNNPSTEVTNAIQYLQKIVKSAGGYQIAAQSIDNYNQSTNAIVLGEISSSKAIQNLVTSVSQEGEVTQEAEGYMLDISQDRIILAGCDSKGVFNGVSTLAQLMVPGNVTIFLNAAHIFDYPDYKDRWVIAFHNLRGNGSIPALNKILDTMAYRKLNAIQHTDFKYFILQDQPKYYFDSAAKFINLCKERDIEIVPGVMNFGWSSGILYHNPNLAEGLQTSAMYYIEGDTGRLVPDPRAKFANGGFENVNSNGKFTGWAWYDENFARQDLSVFHSGKASAKCTNFDGSNSRFCLSYNCQPYRGYVLSAWIKTENFSGGEVRLFAYPSEGNNYRAVTFTQLSVPATSGNWFKVQVYFNNLTYQKMNLYAGVWGAKKGTIWWDDIEVKDLGLTNILRREGTPLTVMDKTHNRTCTEGVDFEPVVDNIMLGKYGEYGPFHQPPTFKIKPGSNIQNGDSVLIISYHPFVAVSDNNCSGSVMVCPSEDTLYKIVEDQSSRVNDLLHPARFFMSHDEIRNMNWDEACQKRELTPADLLSDNVTKCYNILKKINPNSEILVWSDMFDSLHNANNNYYLINGDLGGIWNKIPKDMTIANWNGGKAAESLRFFEKLGYKQITSPYYDDHSTNNIRHWRLAQEGVKNINGMMYTTWETDYSQLSPFSYYAWGAGPAIYFTPPDSITFLSGGFNKSIKIQPDFYDNTDKITSAFILVESLVKGNWLQDTFQLTNASLDFWSAFVSGYNKAATIYTFSVIATNSQGITRKSPKYIIRMGGVDDVSEMALLEKLFNLQLTPNPTSDFMEISYSPSIDRRVNPTVDGLGISIYNVFGEKLLSSSHYSILTTQYSAKLDVSGLSSGVYFVRVGEKVGKFVKY